MELVFVHFKHGDVFCRCFMGTKFVAWWQWISRSVCNNLHAHCM